MRLSPIHEEYPDHCDERAYLTEVVTRLCRIVGDSLDELHTVALMDTLVRQTYEFADGFVLNDETKLSRVLGYEEASVIGACLSAPPGREPAYWKRLRLNTVDDARLRRAAATVERLLTTHPGVRVL